MRNGVLGIFLILVALVAVFGALTFRSPEPVVSSNFSAETVEPAATDVEADLLPATTAENAQLGRVDIIRMDEAGGITMAGQAQPNVTLKILLDGQEIGEAKTDDTGFFATQNQYVSANSSAELSIVDSQSGAAAVDQQFLLNAPTQAIETTVSEAPQPTTTDTAEATKEPEANVPQAAPSIIALTASGDLDVRQPSISLTPEALSVEAISYSQSGEMVVTGATGGSGEARVYLDNQFVAAQYLEQAGSWTVTLPDIDTGTYTMRVDRVAPSGAVVSRVETPIAKEAPETLAALTAQTITVQPGFTLWRIASDRYGSGVDYVKVFSANQDKIKNPDLIYPGQVFNLPN